MPLTAGASQVKVGSRAKSLSGPPELWLYALTPRVEPVETIKPTVAVLNLYVMPQFAVVFPRRLRLPT